MPDLVPVRRALISVSDKSGLVALARALASRGVRMISTGGTARALTAAGFEVTTIETVTGFPEIMDGRVKTLHPKIHGGLLAVRDDPAHARALSEHGIEPIDLVCVNLYPFERTIASPGVTRGHAIEDIDIGGPSMVRSAAKNADWVAVVTDPGDYPELIAELEAHDGSTTLSLRRRLQARAFARTAAYDAAIAAWLAPGDDPLPPRLVVPLERVRTLRYGENPHQKAALYRRRGSTWIADARQLHGKELSYNNIHDAAVAFDLALQLSEPGRPGACVVKHANPCGAAAADSVFHAVDLALSGDELAAYGGIAASGAGVDAQAAERIARKDVFLEVLVAPAFDADALDILRAKSAHLRILQADPGPPPGGSIEFRSIPGGVLAQTRDDARAERYEHRAGPPPTDAQLALARCLEPVCRALTSNAVCLGVLEAGRFRLVGAGAGQVDRLQACRIAVEKAGRRARGALAFSDAFFPFADGPAVLIDAGVTCIVHPGGSRRDDETFALCNERGVTCLTTGVRHFRH